MSYNLRVKPRDNSKFTMSYNLLNNPQRTQGTRSMFDLFSTSKFRSATSQICAAFPYYCLKFSYGISQGFQIILLAALYQKDSEIAMTTDQLSWFASLTILSGLSTIVTGLAMHRINSRVVALAENALLVASGLSHYYSTSASTVLVGRALSGLVSPFALTNSYVTEISEPHLRSTLLVVSQMSSMVGLSFSLMLANFFHWRTITLINLCFSIIAAVTVLFAPNSPAWLANKGRLDAAQKALCKLRGWVKPSEVQTELQALVENVQKSKADAEAITVKSSSRLFFQLFLQRSFYFPLFTMCTIFTFHILGGIQVILAYSAIIFQKINSPMDPSIGTSIMGAIAVIGNVVAVLLIHRIGKRKLAFFSVLVAGSSYSLIALVGFLKLEGNYLWVPPVALLIGFFAECSGISAIINMINCEYFPSSVRYIGSSIVLVFSVTLISIFKKLFLYAIDLITLSGVFLLFSVASFTAFVVFYFVMPETEGKSLEEIEDHFRGEKKLNERGQL